MPALPPQKLAGLARPFCFLVVLLWSLHVAQGEFLPVKTYTTADGLPRDSAFCIVQDSRGFLWFCTTDGLSRFDGYKFTNYTTDDGLPHRVVNHFLETRNGAYWVATNDGLARFNPSGRREPGQTAPIERMFTIHKTPGEPNNSINIVLEDKDGKLWCGTDEGLYWFDERDGTFHHIELIDKRGKNSPINSLVEDRQGGLWVGTEGSGLYRIRRNGKLENYSISNGLPVANITTLLLDQDNNLWVGMSSTGGACRLVREPLPGQLVVSRCYTQADGLANNWIRDIHQTSDGRLWFSTVGGLTTLTQQAGSVSFNTYKETQGLCSGGTFVVREDREGNVWVGTSCGIKRIKRSGFVRYGEADGLASLFVTGIFSSKLGELFVVTKLDKKDAKASLGVHSINRFTGNRFDYASPRLPQGVGTGWGGGQLVLQDSSGSWWLPGDKQNIYVLAKADRLSELSKASPKPIRIPDQEVFRIYEDSRGDTWISTTYEGHLLKYDHSTHTIRDYKNDIGGKGYATCFAEDRSGNLWIGFDYGDPKLGRYRNGHFSIILNDETRAGGGTTSLYVDRAGRLWTTSKLNGVARVDDPTSDQIHFVWYNRKNGLATDGTASIVEDQFGRIYIGHGRGVDRLDPSTGQFKHYTTADGLPRGAIEFAAADNQGALWFGSHGGGAARLIPEPDKPRKAPTILLTGLRIAGQKQNVSDLGEGEFADLTLEPSQNQVSVDFVGLGASLGEELRYRYKMEGTLGDWSEPTSQRTVDFPILSAGTYRLLVKAITAEGTESAKPAAFTFTILPPIWQRWWFLLIAATLLISALFALYRYRITRLLELERVRTRIASDLHDDIGASLSRIAIMTEVVKRKVTLSEKESLTMLSAIADSARDLTGSMRDIVWAIDPRRDDLASVISRIREFASDVFEGKGIKWEFDTPSNLEKMQLGPDHRRHLLLFFKEAINNAARHSNCQTARLSIAIVGNSVVGKVFDDGKGISVPQVGVGSNGNEGHGFANMERRVNQLNGTLLIDSAPGKGMHLSVTIPIKRH